MTGSQADTSRTLRSITLQNFRGVKRRTTFALGAPVVLFYGPNGTGKTTVFDAFVWLLLGDIPRLAVHTMRRNEDYVVNSYAPGQVASVELSMEVDGVLWAICRTGDSRKSTLSVEGPPQTSDAESVTRKLLLKNGLSLAEALTTSGLLQQDDLRLLLKDKPDQRYLQLLRLLGLESLERFEARTRTWAKQRRDSAAEVRALVERERSRLAEVRAQLDALREVTSQVSAPVDYSELDGVLSKSRAYVDVDKAQRRDAQLIATVASATLDRIAKVVEQISSVTQSPPRAVSVDVGQLRATVERLRDEGEKARVEVDRAVHVRDAIAVLHQQYADLAALALPMLHSSHADSDGRHACPVCESRIDADVVAAHLGEKAAGSAEYANAVLLLDAARARDEELKRSFDQASVEFESAIRITREAEDAERDAAAILSELRSLSRDDVFTLPGLQDLLKAAQVEKADAWLRVHGSIVNVKLDEAQSCLIAVETAAASIHRRARAASDLAQRSSEIPRLTANLSTLQTSVGERTLTLEEAVAAEDEAAQLSRQTSLAVQGIFEDRFSSLEPLMNDIYARLDPHPTFRRLDFRIESYRSRGTATATVTDDAEDVVGNPLLVFSSAQANIVVLSAFLALGWASGAEGLPFVLLDDPLQSLDDVNVLGFADLMRQVRERKQVLISTHEQRFAALIERKMIDQAEGAAVIVHRFEGWDRNGPTGDFGESTGIDTRRDARG